MSPLWKIAAPAVVVMLSGCLACSRETRIDDPGPALSSTVLAASNSELYPGGKPAEPRIQNPYANNAQALNEGRRLFNWFNCSGCHSNGGGGMGPALIDDVWIYGNQPANIFESIVEGRPNGMPSFRGKIPDHQVWQITAYVQWLNQHPPEQ
jgi:cytochrome c oxidase cbb3-type subunit 3